MITLIRGILTGAIFFGTFISLDHVKGMDVEVNLPVGEFSRPTGSSVSGAVDATTKYRRSPCPALNALANHGYLPRDGRRITRDMAKEAIMTHFNLAEDLANLMVRFAPDDTFDLNDLSKHNDKEEHDGSLSRLDAYFGADPALITPWLTNDLLAQAEDDGKLTVPDLVVTRQKRIYYCAEQNPECGFFAKQQFLANMESALLLRAMGGKNTEEISYDNLYSFFFEERFPDDFEKATTPISYVDIARTIAHLEGRHIDV